MRSRRGSSSTYQLLLADIRRQWLQPWQARRPTVSQLSCVRALVHGRVGTSTATATLRAGVDRALLFAILLPTERGTFLLVGRVFRPTAKNFPYALSFRFLHGRGRCGRVVVVVAVGRAAVLGGIAASSAAPDATEISRSRDRADTGIIVPTIAHATTLDGFIQRVVGVLGSIEDIV